MDCQKKICKSGITYMKIIYSDKVPGTEILHLKGEKKLYGLSSYKQTKILFYDRRTTLHDLEIALETKLYIDYKKKEVRYFPQVLIDFCLYQNKYERKIITFDNDVEAQLYFDRIAKENNMEDVIYEQNN